MLGEGHVGRRPTMNERVINEISGYLERDRNKLIRIQRNRGVLNSDDSLNEELIRTFAKESLQPIIQLFIDKRIPVKQTFDNIQRYNEKNDEEKIFNLIFFYCEFYSRDLPELLLPLAINKIALRIYFNEWTENMKQHCS